MNRTIPATHCYFAMNFFSLVKFVIVTIRILTEIDFNTVFSLSFPFFPFLVWLSLSEFYFDVLPPSMFIFVRTTEWSNDFCDHHIPQPSTYSDLMTVLPLPIAYEITTHLFRSLLD